MSEDREERNDELEGTSQPSTAAARRERRASRSAAKERGDDTTSPATVSTGTTESKGRATPARDSRNKERVSPFRKIGRFLREVVAELRKVIWPTRKQLGVYTLVVLVFVSIMVAFVAVLDLLAAKGVMYLFG